MINKAAIFEAILKRNALRRQAGLPEWPVRQTYDEDVRRASWRQHVEQNHAVVRMQVLQEQRAKFGQDYPLSTGGAWAVNALVNVSLSKSFQASYACVSVQPTNYVVVEN